MARQPRNGVTLTENVKVRLSADDAEALRRLGERLDRSVSNLIRRAVRDYLARNGQSDRKETA